MRPNPLYGHPQNGKKLTDSLAVGEAPAVVIRHLLWDRIRPVREGNHRFLARTPIGP